MEKEIHDKSELETNNIPGTDPDRYEAGYGSFNEKDFEKPPVKKDEEHITPGGTVTGSSDEANIKAGMNEAKSTVSNTAAPSGTLSDEEKDTNSNAS